MKKLDHLNEMSPVERRDFLKLVSGFLSIPMINGGSKNALIEMLVGQEAYAQALAPMNFLEVNLRDQWDLGSLFVPPSVAQNFANIRSRLALFDQPIQERNGFYLTPQAAELRPHLDDIAVMEIGECPLPGNTSVHGHEAGNPLRSPGRSKTGGAGRFDMASVDKRPNNRAEGNEILYSSTPTPMVLHNYYQKSITPSIANAVLMRSTLRADVHTYYHYEAGLTNAQPDRYFDKATFLSRLGTVAPPAPILSNLQKHGALIARFLKRLDDSYLNRVLASATQKTQHGAKTDSLGGLLASPVAAPTNLNLSAAELAYWRQGIGEQVVCPGDDASSCTVGTTKWHAGELFASATKLIQSGRVRTVGIDFDMTDIHTNRTPFVMYTQAQQSGMTLARMIQTLKASGHWQNTIIAMYTLDGSRSPLLSSTGEDSKNSILLAGGKIKGGYYGDIQVSTAGTVTYRRPGDNGLPIAVGTTGREMRVPAADVYKTVLSAAGVPMSVLDSFPDVRPGKILSYMMKA